MAWDDAPTSLFAGYDFDGSVLTIALTDLAPYGLTSALANQGTGDSRAIARALAARIYDWYQGLATANRPQALTASLNLYPVTPTATSFAGTVKETVQITTYLNYADDSVATEPA